MQAQEELDGLIGLHQFTAYAGDLEYAEDGSILNEVVYESPVVKNLIVTTGKNLAMDRLFGLGADTAISAVGVGGVATAPTAADTQLNVAGTAGEVLIKAADAGTSRTNQTVTIKATFATTEANFTWDEAGLFNGTTNGTSRMFNRVIIGPFAKTSAVSIVYTTTVTQS